jgi:hypothetical protein
VPSSQSQSTGPYDSGFGGGFGASQLFGGQPQQPPQQQQANDVYGAARQVR